MLASGKGVSLTKRTLEDIYAEYGAQIDAITSILGMKYRKAARAISWIYGGTEEGWRKLLAKKTGRRKIRPEVAFLLRKLTRKK